MKKLIILILITSFSCTEVQQNNNNKVLLNGNLSTFSWTKDKELLTVNGKLFTGDRKQIKSLVKNGIQEPKQPINTDFMLIAVLNPVDKKVDVWMFQRTNSGGWILNRPYSYSYSYAPADIIKQKKYSDPNSMDYER